MLIQNIILYKYEINTDILVVRNKKNVLIVLTYYIYINYDINIPLFFCNSNSQ